MNNTSSSHDLLLLMLSLAQIDNPDKITSLFVEAIEGLFAPAHFEFRKADGQTPDGGFALQTMHKKYGWIVVGSGYELTRQQQELLYNAIQMLAIVVERNEQAQILTEDRERLRQVADDRAIQLLQTNQELREANSRLQEEVSRHRQTSDELQESQTIFSAFMEHNPAYVFFKDEQLRALKLSRNFEQMLGRPLPEILGKTMDELFPPNLAKPMIEVDQKILQEGRLTTVEEELDGHYYSTIKFPIEIAGKKRYLAGFTIDLTESKLAEMALKESEIMLASSQQIAHVGSWKLDLLTNQLTWSAETYRICGVDPQDFSPSYASFLEIVHPDDRAFVDEAYTASVREYSESYEIGHRVVRRDNGQIRHVVEKCRHARNEAGDIIRSYGMIQDITEQKLADDALRNAKATAEENETRFKALHNASFGGIAIHDKGRILDCNQGLAEIFGYSVEELIGMDGLLLVSEETRNIVKSNIQSHYEKPYEAIGVRKNGEEFPMRLEGREIPYRGKYARTVEFRDITEQKRAEEAIAAEKERLAVTLRSIGDGVITTDTQGNVQLMNRVAEELTGWSQREAQGQPLASIFNIIHEVTRLPCESPVEKVMASGGIIELTNHTVLISRNGTERFIADSGAPIKDMNSVTLGVVMVFRDMTEKKKLLDLLQRTDKLEAIGILAGGIAHDFNNLLSGVFGYIELARMSADVKTMTSYLDQAMVVFSRAKNLTQQLLTFSKGGAPLRKTGDLVPVVKESALFSLSGSNVTCEFEIAEDLWAVDFDRGQIGQVIDNLVINAQQSMPIGGKLGISMHNVSLKDGETLPLNAGNFVRISITDTGTGMHPELLKRIFDPFFTTKQKGNGLGLATSYAIIQKHSGMIDVESILGKGSTFHVYLPASFKKSDDTDTSLPVVHQGHGRILIMDDEEFVRIIVSKLLKSMGYGVVEAREGEEAVKLLLESAKNGCKIDAVIFDLTVPGGMGGKDAIVLLRQHFPELPAFVSSGYSEDPVMAQPQKHGFTDCLRKPYRRDELSALLSRNLNKSADR